MTPPVPAALLLPVPGGDAAATTTALTRQTVAPAGVLLATTFATFADALRAASTHGPWVWLLDSGVIPDPAALEQLLGALAAMPTDPPPGLVASQVRAGDGRPDRASIPAIEAGRPRRVLRALERRSVALRAARYGSLLVHGPAAVKAGATARGGVAGHDLAWTARLLEDRGGVLVPPSVVTRSSGRRPARSLSRPRDILTSVQLLAEIPARDRLWFFVRLLGGPPSG